MKNFDTEREALPALTFWLEGREWHVRREVRPEALMAYEELKPDDGLTATMKVMDDLVCACLVPEEGAAWLALRIGDEASIGLSTITGVAVWLIESVVARPTGQPLASSEPSANGTSGTPLTVASPLPEAGGSIL